MKHPEELKTKFLELRARGVSYGHIAEEIGVSKPTLIQWGKDMAVEIADLQAAERELVREKLLGNFEQWLGRQVHHFNRLDEEFGRREFKYSPTESVFRMMMASRKLLDRYFFEDDRPRQRRASEGRAPSSPAVTSSTSQPNGRAAAPPAAASDSEAPAPENPSKIQPFPNRIDGDSIPNQQSETDCVSAPSRLCVESGPQNPAKTLPFPCQNSGVNNPNLSQSAESEGRAPSSPLTPPESQTGSSEADFGGESVPISPFESTRPWLERQGIRIPAGARIVTAG